MAFVGEERLASVMRALASAEMYLHSDFYASHPHLDTQHSKKNKVGLDKRMLEHYLSLPVSDHLEKTGNISESIKREALLNCENKRWSPFVCMMAMANVLDLPIHSFYPETGGIGTGRNYYNLKNVLLEPRERSERPSISLLWTLSGGTLKDLTPSFKPNHVVPLFKVEDIPDVEKPVISTSSGQSTISFLKAKPLLKWQRLHRIQFCIIKGQYPVVRNTCS